MFSNFSHPPVKGDPEVLYADCRIEFVDRVVSLSHVQVGLAQVAISKIGLSKLGGVVNHINQAEGQVTLFIVNQLRPAPAHFPKVKIRSDHIRSDQIRLFHIGAYFFNTTLDARWGNRA